MAVDMAIASLLGEMWPLINDDWKGDDQIRYGGEEGSGRMEVKEWE